MEWLQSVPIARGGLHDEKRPENSLEAFTKAIEEGYGIELSVHLSPDGVLLVFDEYSLERMTGVVGDIRRLDSGFTRSLELLESEARIPTLQEVLRVVDGQVPLLIEIKSEGAVGELESAIVTALKGYRGEVAVESFNPYTLAWFVKNAPEFARGQRSGSLSNTSLPSYKKFLLRNLFVNFISKPNFIVYEADALPRFIVKMWRNKPLLSWTVRSHEEQAAVLKHSDNIIFESMTPLTI